MDGEAGRGLSQRALILWATTPTTAIEVSPSTSTPPNTSQGAEKVPTHPDGPSISTDALCGFANFSSVGIQLANIGAILASIGAIVPHRTKDLSRIVPRALFAGLVASLSTACIASLLIDD
ncbi:hypothetical protein T484DRAFT_1901872 [Baffinella frigidus]|nr:hypothetical protein T484DRAFT_1901872 [Cryptophyta sp. CCMP2293]